jgi:hypothetical protein
MKMSEQQQIDEILLEANAYGLKKEVEDTVSCQVSGVDFLCCSEAIAVDQ